ncbi:MAG: M1 family metallopeptidase [Bacteroidota bacterium]
MNKWLLIVFAVLFAQPTFGQLFSNKTFTRQDTLRGSITPEREWWDLKYYELSVKVEPDKQFISGENIVTYEVISEHDIMQIDLQPPMVIDAVTQNKKPLEYTRDGNVYLVKIPEKQAVGSSNQLSISFSGAPRVAKNAPWDGGFSWDKDDNGNHFVATSCQGLGASVWWPCKDHMYDEPEDGMLIHVNVPDNLIGVANGRLIKEKKGKDKTHTFTWKVVNPINNYGVNVNIADYVRFSEVYDGEKGPLDMDYWVLSYNLELAKEHFKDAVKSIEAFEHWFGPYPFYEDSYKLVEVPYLGMEHQSSVTYGNKYKKGYLGNDLSRTGWGLEWDYIIIHETGHEWFANSITYVDIADMWIHEGFTTYSESLFVEYFHGKEAGAEYTRGTRMSISNTQPIIGQYFVNAEGSGDMYAKGNNLLHTLRQVINDDEKWRQMLRGLNEEFYHKTVTTAQVEEYMAKSLDLDLETFFNQYLRDNRIPVFEYWVMDGRLAYRWSNCVRGFNMPLKIYLNGKETWITPSRRPQVLEIEDDNLEVKVDPDFYVYSLNTMGN